MKNILNSMCVSSISQYTMTMLKIIMNINCDNKPVVEVLQEVRDKWNTIDSYEKRIISESLVGKLRACKFEQLMN